MIERVVALAAVLALTGCVLGGGSEDDDEPTSDGGMGASDLGERPDLEPPDMAPPDAMVPDAMLEPCGPVDVTVAVDPGHDGTQFHPAVAADGDGLWIVYNRVTPDESTFDVWATRLGCDGQATVPPFEVSEDPVYSDVDPAVAVGPTGVLFAWTNDVSDATPNLITRTRMFDHDGAPLGASKALITRRAGQPFGGGQWMVRLATTPEGFVVAGARGVDELSAFQVYGQRLDSGGEPMGATASAERNMTQQLEPDVAVAADGAVWIAWAEGDQGAGSVKAAIWRDNPELAAGPMLPAPAGSARLAGGADVILLGHVERNGGTDIGLQPVFGDRQYTGQMGAIDIQPALARVGDRGVLAWFRRVQGNRSAIYVQRVKLDDGVVLEGAPEQVPLEGDAAPYPMALTALGDGRIAMVWSEGVSPDFRLRVRYLVP